MLSLSLRLFGNIFGEELVILILFSIVPFLVPLPMMFLGLITGGLQAFIFVLLSIIYLQARWRWNTSTTSMGMTPRPACTRRRRREDQLFVALLFFRRRLGS